MPRRIQVEIVGDSRSVERAFGRAGRSAGGFASRVEGQSRRIGRSIAVLGTSAVALGAVTSRSFASFEQSLSQIVGLAGGTRESVKKMGDEILRLGPEVAKSPQELAETLYFVASAGIAVADQMDVVELSAKAAAAGLGETQTVADAVSSAMNAYGASVLDAANATDVLVNTVRFGKGEADSFAPVLGTVAAIAAQLGVRFEEVGAALAAQTRLGISAETAAIQLQATFSSLLKTTPKAAKALASVGLSAGGLREQLKERGLLSVLETLKEAFGDNTAAMAEAFPNIRALRGLLTLVGKNADSTREVFAGMADSTGALATAFEAVTEDEAFKFQQTLASLRAASIRLGAIFAPVARLVARGASAALGAVNSFLERLGEARTIRAKLAVVWTGVRDAALGATDALREAVARIDFDAVWEEARGVADGLQQRIEEIDWSFVGEEIGDAIVASVDRAVPAAKELGERITEALRSIDFEDLGRQLGPALAAAMVSAFATLLDPGFWIRNWDLALAIGVTAFSGPIGRLGAALVRPFATLGARMVGAITPALIRGLTALPPLVARALLRLPAVAVAPLRRLASFLRDRFARLGSLTRFTIRVLGLTAAINAVKRFVSNVGNFFAGIPGVISRAFERGFDSLKEQALRAALAIVEPFTHLPGFLGGGTFRDLKDKWKAMLDDMESDTESAVRSVQSSIDSVEGKTVEVTVVTSETAGGRATQERDAAAGFQGSPDARDANQAAAQRRADRAAAAAADEAADDAERRADSQKAAAARAAAAAKEAREAAQRAARLKRLEAERVRKAAEAAREAAEREARAFDELMANLSLKLAKAQVTADLRNDIGVLKEIERAILDRIKEEGRTADLATQLFENRQAQAQARRSQRQREQFQFLGLTGEGEDRVPSAGSLRKRLGSVEKAVEGTALDTRKTNTLLRRLRRLLSGQLGALSDEVRAKIKQMLDDLNADLASGTDNANKKLTRRRITAGNSFSAFGVSFGGGGAAGRAATLAAPPIHVQVLLDSREIGDVIVRDAQGRNRRTVGTRRGRHGGARLF